MSKGITLLIAKSLLLFFNYGDAYYDEYSAGFSGVLFAMKVVLDSQSDDYTNIYGVLVPTRFAAWAELILIQMLEPSVSFLGHLGGILAGLVYVNISSSNQRTRVVRYLFGVVGWPITFVRRLFGFGRRSFGRGNIGGSQTRIWRCRACTYDNADWSSTCEMCGIEHEDDNPSLGFSDETNEISLEEEQIMKFHYKSYGEEELKGLGDDSPKTVYLPRHKNIYLVNSLVFSWKRWKTTVII